MSDDVAAILCELSRFGIHVAINPQQDQSRRVVGYAAQGRHFPSMWVWSGQGQTCLEAVKELRRDFLSEAQPDVKAWLDSLPPAFQKDSQTDETSRYQSIARELQLLGFDISRINVGDEVIVQARHRKNWEQCFMARADNSVIALESVRRQIHAH